MKLRGDRAPSSVGPACQEGCQSSGIGTGTWPGTEKLDGVTIRWLQYAGLQHLASPVASPDQKQLLHDLLLQEYRDHSLLWSGNFKDNIASSSINTPKVGGGFGNGLLDLKSIDDSTGFLSEDSTVEPFDLLPVSPPKGIRNDLNSIGSVKSEGTSNKKTKAPTDVKQSNAKGRNIVKDITVEQFDLFPISPPKGKSEVKMNNDIIRASTDRKKIKGKNVHKDSIDEVPSDFSPLRSPMKVEEYKEISNNTIEKSEKKKDTNDVAKIKDVAVVAEQFDLPAWSPTRGLYGNLNLMRGEESKRNSEGPDSDFDFMRGQESKRRSSPSINARASLSKRTHKSKEKIHTKDKVMEVKSGPLDPVLEVVSNPNPSKGLNNEFNSIMEELSKWSSRRGSKSSSAHKKEIVSKDLDNAFSSAMEELSKLQSIRSARSSSASKKDFISEENNSAKITLTDVVSEPIGTVPVSLSSGINNEFNSAIEELSKWQSTKGARSPSANRKNINSKDIKAEPVDFTQNPSPNSKEVSSDRNEKMIDEQIQVSNSTPTSKTKKQFGSKRISSKEENSARIRVVVRKRPLNQKEISRKEKGVLYVDDYEHLTIHEPKLKVDLTAYVEKHEFNFDAVFDEHTNNDEVYNVTVGPIIPTIFEGAKITCFAFGQTGSGKTFTMQPLPLRASRDIVHLLHQRNQYTQSIKLWVSYFEIYGKKIIDLLNDRRKLCIREDGNQQVCIVGLQEYEITDAQTIQELISKGNAMRSTGSTGANEESSRSHSILQLAVKMHPTISLKSIKRKSRSKIVGKISFIDLAGSERGADSTHNDREKRNEGVEINKSLLALKECIRALDNDKNHVPFRGSKLTEVLRDSFIGDSRTVMICCVSPSAASCEQTLNSLRYAERVKNLSKGSYSKKEQVPSPVSNESKDIFEQENQDQEEENIAITQRNEDEDIYSPATEVSETSFRFMPNYYNLREREGDEEEQLAQNSTLGQNKMNNTCDISYGSSSDFGTQNLVQVFSKDEDIDGEIKTLIEEESSRLSPQNSSFDGLDEGQVQDNFDSKFNLITNPKESLIEANEENQNYSNIVSGSNLYPKSQEEASFDPYEEEFSSDNGEIKTILEEKGYTVYVHNKEQSNTIETDYKSNARITSENHAKEEGHEAIQNLSEETERIDANYLDLSYRQILNQNQTKYQHTDEEAPKYERQIDTTENESHDKLKEKENSIINTTKMTHIENISSLEFNHNLIRKEERETKLSLLETRKKDLQVISSSSSPTTKSEASTQNSLNITENGKKSNQSPHKRIPRKEKSKKKRDHLIKSSGSKSNSKDQNEQQMSEEKQNKMEGSRKEWPISTLFQEEEALLAAHRKVIQNTMNILREELNMLAEVDQAGSFINNYVTQLSFVLSRKASDLASLQTRVVRFQQCLREQDKLGRMSFP